MTTCVEREVLHRFAEGTASASECRQVVRHFLTGCRSCAAVVRSAFRPAIEEGAYDGALARLATWVRDRDLVEAGFP